MFSSFQQKQYADIQRLGKLISTLGADFSPILLDIQAKFDRTIKAIEHLEDHPSNTSLQEKAETQPPGVALVRGVQSSEIKVHREVPSASPPTLQPISWTKSSLEEFAETPV